MQFLQPQVRLLPPRPDVVSERLTPEQTIKKVLAVAAEIPQMAVLGTAGPEDHLTNPSRTVETFEQLPTRAPDIKHEHPKEVSKIVKTKGAFQHNAMPLIAEPEYGTYYGVMEQPEPTPEMLQDLHGDMAMMHHCRHCRANAVGLLGEDRGNEFTLDKIDVMDVNYKAAMVIRKVVHDEIIEKLDAILAACAVYAKAAVEAFDAWMRAKPVDIGNTVRRNLITFRRAGNPEAAASEHDAGNGAAMRVLPVALKCYGQPEKTTKIAIRAQARVTHHDTLSDATCDTLVFMVQDFLICRPPRPWRLSG